MRNAIRLLIGAALLWLVSAIPAQAQFAYCTLFSTSLVGCVPASGGGTTNFLRADGTWAAPAGGAGGITVGTTTVTGGTSLQVLYNNAGVVGNYTNIQLTALCQQFTAALSGCVPLSGGGTTTFLRADGSWVAPPIPGSGAGSGSVTSVAAGTGLAASPSPIIATGTLSLDTIANNTMLGNTSGGTAVPTAQNSAAQTTMCDTFSTAATTKGCVPGSNGAAATSFLNATGAWSVPTTGIGTAAASNVAVYSGTNTITGSSFHNIASGDMLHGLSGALVGTSSYANLTSGSITLQPTTGALGSTVLILPVRTATATVATTTGTLTNGNCTKIGDASGNMSDVGLPCYQTWTTAGRGTATTGKIGYNTDLGVVEYYNGTNWTAVRDAMSHQKYVVNNWYASETAGIANAGATAVLDTIICTYDEIITPVTIKTLGTNVTTLQATNFQLALYKQDATTGRPAGFLAKTANISMGAAGAISSATLDSGGSAANIPVGLGTANGKDIWICVNRAASGAGILASKATTSPNGPGRIGSATLNAVTNAATGIQGVSCTGAACQGGVSTFNTWPASLATSTWTDVQAATVPRAAFQVASSP